jgi:hypothetical protein
MGPPLYCLSKGPDDIGADFHEQASVGLASAVQPFMFDERHRGIYTLGGPSDLARDFDEAQRTEPPLPDTPSLRYRPHVAI